MNFSARNIRALILVWTSVAVLIFSACQQEEMIPLDVPEGWQADGARWWRVAADTTTAFRDLETLQSMRVKGSTHVGFQIGSGDWVEEEARMKLVLLVKKGLIQLFRNDPEIVDSLFEKHVAPRMADARVTGDVRPVINQFKKEGYRILARHFRQPFAVTKLGVDVPLLFPDSLRAANVSGEVFLQIYISEEGEPTTIEKLRGVHPILDRIAMRAMTKMRWQPAYVVEGLKSPAVPSWARYTIRFGPHVTP